MWVTPLRRSEIFPTQITGATMDHAIQQTAVSEHAENSWTDLS